jgi:hypothetical protein
LRRTCQFVHFEQDYGFVRGTVAIGSAGVPLFGVERRNIFGGCHFFNDVLDDVPVVQAAVSWTHFHVIIARYQIDLDVSSRGRGEDSFV